MELSNFGRLIAALSKWNWNENSGPDEPENFVIDD
jgi:hypothetical protein